MSLTFIVKLASLEKTNISRKRKGRFQKYCINFFSEVILSWAFCEIFSEKNLKPTKGPGETPAEFNHLQKSQKIEHIKQEPMYTLDTARQAFGVAATENEMLHSNGSMFLSAALQQANQDGESDSGNSQDSDHEPG